MYKLKGILPLLIVLGSSSAHAEDAPSVTASESKASSRPWYALSNVTHVGVQLDVGVPGGGGATLLFRPWWWVRFNGGLAYNYVGHGVRGGVSVVPFHGRVTPSLSIDYGRYLSGDASRFATASGPAEQALLQKAKYDFATAQVGLEFGSQRWFSFYVRGGLTYVTAGAEGSLLTAYFNEQSDGSMVQAKFGDAKLRAVLPGASVGFLIYFH